MHSPQPTNEKRNKSALTMTPAAGEELAKRRGTMEFSEPRAPHKGPMEKSSFNLAERVMVKKLVRIMDTIMITHSRWFITI